MFLASPMFPASLMLRLWSILLFVVIVACPVGALAELPDPPVAPNDAAIARARDDFVRGMERATAEQWLEAIALFRRSYRASGSPVALFNLASALRSLGRFREAAEAFDRLLEDPALGAEARENAERMRAEATARVGVLTLDGVPRGAARVTTDGVDRAPTTRRPLEVVLDPGPRSLEVELPLHAPWRWRGTIEEGARFRLTAEMRPVEPADGALLEDPLFWGIASGALAAVLGVLIGVLVDQSLQLSPRSGYVIELP